MEIIINKKKYQSKKITGRIYDEYLEVSETIDKRQIEGRAGFNKEDMALIREFLVLLFDNKFTADDLYDEIEVASLIVYFLNVSKEIESSMNDKLSVLGKK